jgi:hypothetical protein
VQPLLSADIRDITVLELDGKDGTTRVIEKISVPAEVMPLALSPKGTGVSRSEQPALRDATPAGTGR